MSSLAIVSYRLRGADGVSIEAEKWAGAFRSLGHEVTYVAGVPADGVVVVNGLALDATEPVDLESLSAALEGVDLVIVENVCSLPLNPRAGDAVASALRGRPAILHHHDLAWHRADTAHFGAPPDDPAWLHVTINETHAKELAERSIDARVLYNRFDLDPPAGDRDGTRAALGISADELVVLQPTRALPRKNVPGGLALAESLGATYWLTAAAEDGYDSELAELLAATSARVLRGQGPGTIDDAYAACDLVVLPSTWEGFGNPVIESVVRRRPLALGTYPVAAEIRSLGFSFLDPLDPQGIRTFLSKPNDDVLDANFALTANYFDLAQLPHELATLLDELGLPARVGPADR